MNSQKKHQDTDLPRHQIMLLILSEFKRNSQLFFLLKSSENHRFADDVRVHKFTQICLILEKVWPGLLIRMLKDRWLYLRSYSLPWLYRFSGIISRYWFQCITVSILNLPSFKKVENHLNFFPQQVTSIDSTNLFSDVWKKFSLSFSEK